MWVNHPGVTQDERILLYKLIIARSDISEAFFATRLFLKMIHSLKDEGYGYLQNSIVVSYCRPFKRSRPYGPLPDTEWPGFNDEELRQTHQKLLRHRDAIVAHSDANSRQVQIIPSGASRLPGERKTNEFIAVQSATKMMTLEFMPLIEKVCLDIGGRLNSKIEAEVERLYGKMDLPKVPFDLLEQQD